MQTGLAGDVVAILGAAGGIGAAIARAFAAEGCHLALIDRSDAVRPLATALRDAHGVRVLARVADAADYQAVRDAAAAVELELGGCHHVVVSVGVGSGKIGMPFWSLEPADWEAVVRVNLMACVHAAHAFVPSLLAQRRGSFCFLSSVAGQIGSPTDPPYSAAKAAVLNFTQCAARDLAGHGIRANAICPGMVATELNRSVWRAWQARTPEAAAVDHETWAVEKMRRVTPLARWQTPEDIAAGAVFLASRLADNVTGQTLNVDGGQVMHA
jgi:NAD(P)-dependent dehydrogenase (short-subunit alcohol dehydrogenase family)